ncbi:hypothetical protein ACFC0C_16440 [Streptomyces sp. NPDC056178]|uniref:hypothetical protein n=1 Tax=unclassified Streptomyces TaxID=2593676 RepID=UPI0035DA98B2
MHEPHDLDELTPRGAIDAVIADVRDHAVDPGAAGLFTAIRHIDLISHLAVRLNGDALHHAEQSPFSPDATWQGVEKLVCATATLTNAASHYAQALVPLATLSRPVGPQIPMSQALDRIALHSNLRTHLHSAQQALDETRTVLAGPTRATTSQPSKPVGHVQSPVLRQH